MRENAEYVHNMTMSDTEDQVSTPASVLQIPGSETGDADGQEVNKAKDPAADGGGSLLDILKRPSENCVVDDSLPQQKQSPRKSKAKRGITFPPDNFVSGYCEPPDPWKTVSKSTPNEIAAAYKKSCEKHGTKHLSKVIQQIEGFVCNGKREEKLVLKGEKLDIKQCESLEEILRRVQFKSIDLESCHLDDESAVVWFDMIEYYESAVHLNISYNKNISIRGWQSCARLTRRTPCLTHLDIRNCDMNDRSIPVFGRALKLGCHLTVLHMENMYLSGRSLIILVAALKQNETLQELFLADNRLMPTDGIQLGNLLKYNNFLTLLDLRNNHLQDVGVGHICDGLYEQNMEKGLRTLVLWNNQISYQAMASINRPLGSTKCLETLNLGHNSVTNEGIHILKEGLLKSKSLMRLGLQSTRLTCEGAVALAEYLADSCHLLRLDLRENDIKTAGLMALSLALKVNDSVTRMDLDKDTKKESGMKDYADQQRRLQQEIKGFLERNQQRVLEREEEERRQLEERAEADMAARAAAESLIASAQEIDEEDRPKAVSALEMLFVPPSPTANNVRRPSLLMIESHMLTPQESLESPLCTDVHIASFATTQSREGTLPEMALGVSSPPLSLELQNPLTAQLSGPFSAQTATATSAGSNDSGNLVLPLANPLATALRSPPVELLLSPQYYPKPTARKIFSVTRVVESLASASPTVSQTGLLDAGPASPATAAPAVQQAVGEVVSGEVEGGGEGSIISATCSTPSPITPQLLMQNLSLKTVNEYIQQIVSDTVTVPHTVSESAVADILSPAASAMLLPPSDMFLSTSDMSGAADSPAAEGDTTRTEKEAEYNLGSKTTDSPDSSMGWGNVDVMETDDKKEGSTFRKAHGAYQEDEDEEDESENLDPLGVLKAPVSPANETVPKDVVSNGDVSEPVCLASNATSCDSVNVMDVAQGLNVSEDAQGTQGIAEDVQVEESVTMHMNCDNRRVGCEARRQVYASNTAEEDDVRDGGVGGGDSNYKSVDHVGEDMDLSNDDVVAGTRNIPASTLSNPSSPTNLISMPQAVPSPREFLSHDLLEELSASDGQSTVVIEHALEEEAKETVKERNVDEDDPAGERLQIKKEDNLTTLLLFNDALDESSLFKTSVLLDQQGTEESPLFKTAEILPGFDFTDEDLSLFGATAISSSLAVPREGTASFPGKESEREVSPGAGDSWLTVDASSCSDGDLEVEKVGSKKEPELFTLLSQNGLTQELASVLSSIDDVTDFEKTEFHVPDEFERELDAMLASVKNDLPWPLQHDQLIMKAASKQDEEEENCSLQQSLA